MKQLWQRRISIHFMLVVMLLLPTYALAQYPVVYELSGLLKNISSLSGAYEQTIYNAQGQLTQTATGTMVMQRPNKFRWQIFTPRAQLIVADGKNLWVYNQALQQVTVQPLKQNIAATPALLLSAKPGQLTRFFIVRSLGPGVFILKARSKNTIFQQITLTFNGSQLKQMTMIDNLGQSGRINFSSVKINPVINPSLFMFTPPPGVDVVGTMRR